jgi:hypothetical protein
MADPTHTPRTDAPKSSAEPPNFLARGLAGLKSVAHDFGEAMSTPDPHPVIKDINGIQTDISKQPQAAPKTNKPMNRLLSPER